MKCLAHTIYLREEMPMGMHPASPSVVATNHHRAITEPRRPHRGLLWILVGLIGSFLSFGAHAQQALKLTLEQQVIQNYVGPFCMDVEHGSTSSGKKVEVDSCASVDSQIWDFTAMGGGYYKVVARHSGLCMTVRGGSTQSGRNIEQSSCFGGDSQLWKKVYESGFVKLKNKNSGLCATAVVQSFGGFPPLPKQLRILEQQSCTSSPDRRWVEEISLCGNGFCGDHVNGFLETCASCSQDCGPCPSVCGNGICEVGETCPGCSDCGPCVCGDGVCTFYEGCDTCSQDCGPCACPPPDGICTSEEQAGGCPDCCGGIGQPGCG